MCLVVYCEVENRLVFEIRFIMLSLIGQRGPKRVAGGARGALGPFPCGVLSFEENKLSPTDSAFTRNGSVYLVN